MSSSKVPGFVAGCKPGSRHGGKTGARAAMAGRAIGMFVTIVTPANAE